MSVGTSRDETLNSVKKERVSLIKRLRNDKFSLLNDMSFISNEKSLNLFKCGKLSVINIGKVKNEAFNV